MIIQNGRLVRTLPIVALLACAVASPAWAEDSPHAAQEDAATDTDGRAAELLRAGNEAFKKGDFAAAETAYRAALGIKNGYDIAGNLGMTLVALGKHREAARYLAFTLRLFPVTGEPATRDSMQKALDQCRQEVGALRVRVDPKGATVLVDGTPVGEDPLADEVFVDPGDHVVEARRDGYEPGKRTVTAAKGASLDVTLDLAPIPPPPPVEPPAPAPPYKRWGLAPGLGLAGGALIGIVGGAAFLGASSGKRASAGTLDGQILASRGSCVGGAGNYDTRCPALQSMLRTDDAFHDAGVGMLVIGSAAAAGTLAYFLLPIPAKQVVTGQRLRVTPLAGAREGGVILSGSF